LEPRRPGETVDKGAEADPLDGTADDNSQPSTQSNLTHDSISLEVKVRRVTADPKRRRRWLGSLTPKLNSLWPLIRRVVLAFTLARQDDENKAIPHRDAAHLSLLLP
jgi:hypothetical protein